MNKALRLLIILLLAATIHSCSTDTTYTIHASMAGGKDYTLRLATVHPDGSVRSDLVASRSGVFEIKEKPTTDNAPEIYILRNNDYTFVGAFLAYAEQDINITVDPKDPWAFRADGSDANKALSDWLKANAGLRNKPEALNTAIAAFAKANPSNPLAAVVIANFFDIHATPDAPSQAAAALRSIKPDARPSAISGAFADMLAQTTEATTTIPILTVRNRLDSIVSLDPKKHRATLITFANDETVRRDSILTLLRRYHPGTAEKATLLAIDYSLASDTLTWHRTVARDTASWHQVWSGAGPMASGTRNFGITHLPFYIVADSTGTITYRGPSASGADTALRKILK